MPNSEETPDVEQPQGAPEAVNNTPDDTANSEQQRPSGPVVPDDLTVLSRDELTQLESGLIEHYEQVKDNDDPAEALRIAETLPRIGQRISELDEIEAKRQQAAEAIEQARRAAQDRKRAEQEAAEQAEQAEQAAETSTVEAPEATADAVEPSPEPTPEPELAPVAEIPVPDTPEEATMSETGQPQNEPVAVAASSQRPSVSEIAERAPKQKVPASAAKPREWFRALTAGAEIPGVKAADRFDSARAVTDAVIRRTQSLQVRTGQAQAMVARAHIDELGEPIARAEGPGATTAHMLRAVEKYRQDRDYQALTASGFCAPSETLYDICQPEVADQLVSLPEISMTRGGLQYFPSPDFSVFDDFVWKFCEDELEAGVEKPCPEIPCPDPEEVRACVVGACITADILGTHAFPELTERYVRGVLVAHAMRVSTTTLQEMEDGSTPVVYDDTLLGGVGFTAALLNAIEMQAEDLRADYLLGLGDTIEVILPRWVRGAIRADLANRMGVDLLSVTNQRIGDLFAERGVRVQWVKGWQTEHIGHQGAQLAYPNTVKFLIYREGAWVRALEPVIELDTVYDSDLMRQNKFTRLFTEQAVGVANLCTNSRAVTVPLCPNGATHSGLEIPCFSENPAGGDGEGEGGEAA